MLNDESRNKFYYESLLSSAKDKVVLDIGSGTGILSYYALMCGAKFVYAIEKHKRMAVITDKVLKANFDKKKFKVINANFWNIDTFINKIDRNIDLIVSETIGINLLDEGILKNWDISKKLSQNNMISIPNKLSIDLCFINDINMFYEKIINYENNTITSYNEMDKKFFEDLVEIDLNLNKNKLIHPFIVRTNLFFDKIINDFYEYNFNSTVDFNDIVTSYKKTTYQKLNIESPCVIALIFNIGYNDKTLVLKDGHWKNTPCFVVNEPGIYNISYDGEIWNLDKES